MYHNRLGADLLQSSSAEKKLGILVGNKLSISQQCALVAKKANGVPGHIRKSIASRSREVEPHPKRYVQFWASQDKRDMELLVEVQQQAMKVIKGQKHLSYEERLRELGLFNLRRDN
ncbi:hypothetical protein BTVI_42965 [Pitangus sulphuratus]|nr:hypothetical protein BTVI_42965 [Pitangus sulphuratus]